jgi:hypothetical protein
MAGLLVPSVTPTPAVQAGGMTLIATVDASSSTSISFTSIPNTYKHLLLIWTDLFSPSGIGSGYFGMRLNNDSGANYYGMALTQSEADANFGGESLFGNQAQNAPIGGTRNTALDATNATGWCWIYDYVNSGKKTVTYQTTGEQAIIGFTRLMNGFYNGSAAVSQIDLIRSSTNNISGTLKLYGVA